MPKPRKTRDQIDADRLIDQLERDRLVRKLLDAAEKKAPPPPKKGR